MDLQAGALPREWRSTVLPGHDSSGFALKRFHHSHTFARNVEGGFFLREKPHAV